MPSHLLTALQLASVPLLSLAQTLAAPGQPTHSGTPNTFEVIGESLVSAQQLFMAGNNKIYFVDKVENNPSEINGHPAWASDWRLSDNSQRAMNARTNSFCAGGNVLADGTWMNVGGNQAVTYGGEAAESQTGGGPYDDPDGRNSIRLLKPCDDDNNCDWELGPDMTTRRWYPTLETLADGTMIILGGCQWGGYVNDARQDNPTIEFYPSRGEPTISELLQTTLPVNLFPLTWLLPSGKVLVQSNWKTVLLDSNTLEESPLDDMLDAVRVYPASAGTVMLPLTPANNWTATILFCGGTNLQPDQWKPAERVIIDIPASDSCVTITPDVSPSYTRVDPLPEGRSMPNFIFLPDGKILNINGAGRGTAGYGNDTWAVGMSYAEDPRLTPILYDPNASAGSQWNGDGMQPSSIPRMYHSSAILVPDGRVIISGSNPNADVDLEVKYPSEYRTEAWYPSWYSERRPQPTGLLSKYSYGGSPFDVYLSSDDLSGDVKNLQNTKVVIIRPGFSTHALNMGQRYVQLDSTYTGYSNNTGVLHVSQLPPNPNVLAPGPAYVFVVVNGVPSVGMEVMIGSGEIGKQKTQPVGDLPESVLISDPNAEESKGDNGANSSVYPHSTSAWLWLTTSFVVLGSFFVL